MADSKISNLTEATSLADTDLFVIAQEDTANKKVTWETIVDVLTEIGEKHYLSKPAGTITRASTSIGAFSTAWQITSVVVAAGQNVKLSMSAQAYNGGTGNDALFVFLRGATQLTARLCVPFSTGVHPNIAFEWVDQNPGAGTYTYEIQAVQFTSGTLSVYQGNGSTDAASAGGSIFTATVYTP